MRGGPARMHELESTAARLPKDLHHGRHRLTDEHLDLLAHVLDDWLRIPGTSIRFGLDGLIGLVPGIGDIIAGLASVVIIVAAWLRGVPWVTLTRMVVNVGIDVTVGSIPFFGDIFDIAWKANRRNYALLVARRGVRFDGHAAQTWHDWLFLLAIATLLAAIFLIPALLIVWALEWFLHRA